VRSVWVLNGPNLAQLGRREAVYGPGSYPDLVRACEQEAAALGVAVQVHQTDDEATMLGWLHTCPADGVLLNPAGWTHTSVAVRDAAATLTVPFVEVHLSNPLAREEFRHTSLTAGLARASVAGFGIDGYRLALRGLVGLLAAAGAAGG
jgi:3-dehydroquinate dehydratase-2